MEFAPVARELLGSWSQPCSGFDVPSAHRRVPIKVQAAPPEAGEERQAATRAAPRRGDDAREGLNKAKTSTPSSQAPTATPIIPDSCRRISAVTSDIPPPRAAAGNLPGAVHHTKRPSRLVGAEVHVVTCLLSAARYFFRGSSFSLTYVIPHGPVLLSWITVSSSAKK